MTSNGVEMSIDHKAIEVMEMMVERANETVSTDDFMEKVWHDKPSSPEVIPAAVARLRKVFKKAGISDDLIVTVHKVGYRFEPPPETTPVTSAPPEKQSWFKNMLWLLVLGALFSSIALNVKQHLSKPNKPQKVQLSSTDQTAQIVQESASDVTQIYILRHTEKADDTSEDPELSTAGIKRANYWKKVLQNIDFDKVFTTEFKRNIQTADIISKERTIQPDLYYPMSFDVLKFINQIKGQNVLIIGHSNTIPDMVNRLIDETKYPPMSHQNYNVMYIVTINGNGETSSSMLHIEVPE